MTEWGASPTGRGNLNDYEIRGWEANMENEETERKKDEAFNRAKLQPPASQSRLIETLGVKMITPIVCQLCEMDWEHGACGDCTLTRKQLDGCIGLHRQIELLTDMVAKLQSQLDSALDDHCDTH